MYKQRLTLGVVPVKRSFLSLEEAKRQKKMFMAQIENIDTDVVDLVDIDDIVDDGILYKNEDIPKVIKKLTDAGIDALFLPFCDFGEEQAAAAVAGHFLLPTLVWGARDEKPNSLEIRGRDTQCGMFAATKVLMRYGVKFSYIVGCPADSDEFRSGYDKFVRVAAVLKAIRTLRVLKLGSRPEPFMSVMTNEANLIKRFGITVVPASPLDLNNRALKYAEGTDEAFEAYYKDFLSRFDGSAMSDKNVRYSAAIKFAMMDIMKEKDCSVGAFECWSAFAPMAGFTPCVALGELADEGLPQACETDINGAITMAMLRAAALYRDPVFLADLTIRNPEDDNSELLWHCGPFAHSLKKQDDKKAKLIEGQEYFELKQGHISCVRFDDLDGKYYLFAGEGGTTTGPSTVGTYVYLKVDNWKAWEEHLMFGPYIHHLGGAYGCYKDVMREVARYLDIIFDDPDVQGTYSL